MKKYSKAQATGRIGVSFVSGVIAQAGCIFRETPIDTDLGLDGYIEFVEDQKASCVLVGVQIKCGSSYLLKNSSEPHFQVVVSHADLAYWYAYPVPVAMIAYDPNTKLAAWFDITGFLRSNGGVPAQRYITITFPAKADVFNPAAVNGRFLQTFQQYKDEIDVFHSLELMCSETIDDKLRGFLGLMRHPVGRHSRATCRLLFQHLFDSPEEIRIHVADALSRYLPHPEVGVNPPKHIRILVQKQLQKFGRREIVQLLELAWLDFENLMQRGSLGQSIGVLIVNIPAFQLHLCALACDHTQSPEVRLGSMILADEFGITETIRAIGEVFDRVFWGEVYDVAQALLEECFRLESEEVDLSNLLKLGPDNPHLEEVLAHASILWLKEHESPIDAVFWYSSDQCVKDVARRALVRLSHWKFPPDQYMERLL